MSSYFTIHKRFREVKRTLKSKPSNVEHNREHERLMELAKTIVTKQRVEKLLYKLIDEGIIPEDISNKDIQVIMKNLPSAVYHDCIKEETKIVNQIEHFGKYSGSITIAIIKRIISEKGQKND